MKTFEELGLKKNLNNLQKMGFIEPFPIQEAAIPILLQGKDLIGQAQTGTGKTAAFGLPILENIDENDREVQALIVVPTRELAMQVADELKKFSGGRIGVTAVYGGESMLKQIRFLRDARQIIVATPGRALDYIREKILRLNRVRYVVLDEADRMLDMGFIDDVKEIFRNLPQHRQTSMFSATMPREIMSLANEFMKNPERVSVSKDEISNVMVKQFYMEVNDRDKLNQLCNILQDKKKTIVFCGAKIRVKRLAEDLHKRGFEVEAIHGDMEQPQRTRVINDFKSHKVNILIATDVVARGIDVPTVDRVISYDVPREELTYFHRIGRTARAGESGSAIIFVTNEYKREFDAIRNHTKIKIIKLSISKTPDFPIVRGAGGKSFAGARRFGQFSRSGERGFGSEKRRFDFKRDGFGHSRSGRRSSGKFRKRYNR